MPILDVVVGGFEQTSVVGSRGQRVFERTYDVMLSIIANTQAKDFAETVNLIADQCVRAVGHLDQIAFDLKDFTVREGEYHAD